MITILRYLQTFIRGEWHTRFVLLWGSFLGLSIFINYTFDLEHSFVTAYYGSPLLGLCYFLFYSVPFFFSVVAYAISFKKTDIFRSREFWTLSLYAMFILSFNGSFSWHVQPIREHIAPQVQYFVIRCLNNLNSFVIYVTLIAAYWMRRDRKSMNLYGFRSESFDFKPFFLLLLLVAPLIAWASFQPDFLQKYPRYPSTEVAEYYQIPAIIPTIIFEFCYGLDFITTEFFFRGFMVLAFARFLGRGAVFPMVAVYAFLHFEKPLAEAISSIGGGFVLGVIAYSTRSIYGGIIVHLGVAWMMELAAFMQLTRR